ncbi:MAG TPA: radical SAM family heme chaperone HemW [Caulobacteraceae bacterium]|nr:radical SAM family heme chaperone HemW [Caulobacteraceae bacterium]
MTAADQAGAPLAVYVHWPYCARICPYCDFNVTKARGGEGPARLARAILADLEGHARLVGQRRLGSLFFGGGTPSLMPPDIAGEIVATARRLWPTDTPVEITLEANPADADRFAALAAAGVERLSLGVQSLDDAALAFLGRDHDAAQAKRAVAAALAAFPRVSVDLIYARPGQTRASWAAELAAAAALGPEHISPYQLTIEPETAFGRAAARGRLSPLDEDLALALYLTTQAVLERAGLEAYEISNHARGAAARSRHNLAVWRGGDYLGVGPGAHGRLTLAGGRTATVAARGVGDYVRHVGSTGVGLVTRERLSAFEAAEERLLMGLRTSEGVAWADIAALGLGPRQPLVAELASGGWLAAGSDSLAATAKGRPVLDHLVGRLVRAGASVDAA